MYLSVSISREATKMNTDLYDYPMIAFPCPEKIALIIIGGKFQTLKELWSGRAESKGETGGANPNSSPPLTLQTQQINI